MLKKLKSSSESIKTNHGDTPEGRHVLKKYRGRKHECVKWREAGWGEPVYNLSTPDTDLCFEHNLSTLGVVCVDRWAIHAMSSDL